MDLYAQITQAYPKLTVQDFDPDFGTVLLKDDGNGVQYIAHWNYSEPLPEGMKLGK